MMGDIILPARRDDAFSPPYFSLPSNIKAENNPAARQTATGKRFCAETASRNPT
ncbi:hypothetical protein [Neisseria sp. 19428wB4_WF04]|uniref:hypothetical protein n=1 Tax=Neisseria sp. 19428wB4_WF04 TaxID=2782469 RepID=UPI001884760C|nr:hypothetical protein [Neisseria sp. 19428wB4_WF04]MBF0804072.1 hypothetical protein [Neisseria sp. 19428wB4_WF04]